MKFSRLRQVGIRKTISHNNSINNKDACLGLELAHCSQPQSSGIWASEWLNSSNNQVWDSALLGGGEIWFCEHLIFSRETSLGKTTLTHYRWHPMSPIIPKVASCRISHPLSETFASKRGLERSSAKCTPDISTWIRECVHVHPYTQGSNFYRLPKICYSQFSLFLLIHWILLRLWMT